MSKQRFDVVYFAEHVSIEPHFCREWDDGGGCYGTNPNHGMSFDEACEEAARWHEMQAKWWRDKEHSDALHYIRQARAQ